MTETALPVLCVTCRHWLPQETQPKTVRWGYARCDNVNGIRALSHCGSVCKQHSVLDHDTLGKRLVWLDRIKLRVHEEAP